MKIISRIKTTIKVALIGFTLLVSTTVFSQSYEEGLHYTIIDQQQGRSKQPGLKKNEVVEYFSFSCPGCFSFEPSIKALVDSQASINFRRVHMPYGGQRAKLSQKAFVLMELLNADEYKDTIFSRIHVKRNLFDNDEEIVEFFQELGYERARLEQVMRSFSADTMIRKMNKEASQLKISSVPSVIVNGKYKIIIRSLSSPQDLPLVVSYLNGLD
jgi:thiol:disulfide interchange protein DsbA